MIYAVIGHSCVIGPTQNKSECNVPFSWPQKEEDVAVAFHMPVVDVFDIRTRQGPVVTGVIQSGTVRVGDELMAETAQGNVAVLVVAIDRFQHSGLQEASAGPDDVGIELTGISVTEAKGTKVLRERQ